MTVFIEKKLCQMSPELLSDYKNDNVYSFRKTLASDKGVGENIRDVVKSLILDMYRHKLYDIIAKLQKDIYDTKSKLFFTNNEAVNQYFTRSQRFINQSIDVTFIPSNHNVIHQLFNMLRMYVSQLNNEIKTSFYTISESKIGRILGLKLKTLQYPVACDNFSIYIKVRYWNSRYKNIGDDTLTLFRIIIDNETLNYDPIYTSKRGMVYMNKNTGKINYNKFLFNASKQYIVEHCDKFRLGLMAKNVFNIYVDFNKPHTQIKNTLLTHFI